MDSNAPPVPPHSAIRAQLQVPTSAGLAWQPALDRMGGDVVGFVQLLGGFPQAMFDLLSSLAAALEAQDRPTAIRGLHTLKGLGRTFGAETLAALSQTLELRARAAPEDQPLPVSAEEHAQLQSVVYQSAHDAEQLVQWLQVSEPAAPEGGSATLAELRQLLQQSNLDALDVFLRLDPALTQRAPDTHLALCQALQRLDFAQALTHCDVLAHGGAR
ncbi:MAG: Hpt domain-containing protein [Pseudoxanthomonas sp.]